MLPSPEDEMAVCQSTSTSEDKKLKNESEEYQELPNEYCKGGYHHLRIGEKLYRNRYTVISKLGWGSFSTVWLCWDRNDSDYVAVKVAKSKHCFKESAKEEIDILQNINNCRVVKLLNHFKIRGLNGEHICLVFEVMGSSLYKVINTTHKEGLPIQMLKTVIRQVLEGLHYLHKKCQIIHTDIKPENILFTIEKIQVKRLHSKVDKLIATKGEKSLPDSLVSMAPIDVQQRSQEYNENKRENYKKHVLSDLKNDKSFNSDYIPSKFVGDKSNDISIKIGDLGNACYTYKKFTSTIQTRPYRSPESILGADYGQSADIFSTACMAFELATGDLLFDAHRGNGYSSKDHHLALMIQLLGPIPKNCRKGKYYKKHFSKSGQLLNIRPMKELKLERILKTQYKWKSSNAKAFAQFLLPMLDFDRRVRPTALQCLSHPWLKN